MIRHILIIHLGLGRRKSLLSRKIIRILRIRRIGRIGRMCRICRIVIIGLAIWTIFVQSILRGNKIFPDYHFWVRLRWYLWLILFWIFFYFLIVLFIWIWFLCTNALSSNTLLMTDHTLFSFLLKLWILIFNHYFYDLNLIQKFRLICLFTL